MSHVHAFPCIRSFFSIYSDIFELLGTFFIVFFSPSLSLLFTLVHQWHQDVSLLCPVTHFILGNLRLLILPPLLFGSVIRMPKRTSWRTSLDEAFIRNAESSYRTSPTLTYPLSFIVGVGSHYVTSRSPVLPC